MKDTTTKPTKKESAKSFLIDLIKDIIIALVVVLIVTACVKPTIVSGKSMDDTLHNGNYLIVNKTADRYLYISLLNDPDFEHVYESEATNLFVRKTVPVEFGLRCFFPNLSGICN